MVARAATLATTQRKVMMTRTKVVPMVCSCGCDRTFFVPTKIAWWYPTTNYAFFRIDCDSYPRGAEVLKRTKYVVLEYEEA